MKKKVGIIKRVSCVVLVFLLNINSFAAIVSDNDGSAFITKSEFDALKSSFQAQIDNYNQSIDSKIDGAIASYLAGIKLAVEEDRLVVASLLDEVDCLVLEGPNRIKYKFGMIGISQAHSEYSYLNMERTLNKYAKRVAWDWESDPTDIQKLLIFNLDKTNKIAEWYGFTKDAREEYSFYSATLNHGYSSVAPQGLSLTAGLGTNWNPNSSTKFTQGQNFGSVVLSYESSSTMTANTEYRGHSVENGDVKLTKAIIWKQKDENRFSLQDGIVGFGNKNAINDDGTDEPIKMKYIIQRRNVELMH